MSTSVTLTDDQLEELRRYTERQDPSDAAAIAIQEYIRFCKRQRLIALADEVEMDDNWRELEAAELRQDSHA